MLVESCRDLSSIPSALLVIDFLLYTCIVGLLLLVQSCSCHPREQNLYVTQLHVVGLCCVLFHHDSFAGQRVHPAKPISDLWSGGSHQRLSLTRSLLSSSY